MQLAPQVRMRFVVQIGPLQDPCGNKRADARNPTQDERYRVQGPRGLHLIGLETGPVERKAGQGGANAYRDLLRQRKEREHAGFQPFSLSRLKTLDHIRRDGPDQGVDAADRDAGQRNHPHEQSQIGGTHNVENQKDEPRAMTMPLG